MSKVLVTESSLESIADAIRSKNGLQTTYKPSQMADAIMLLPTTSTLISKLIEANGSYDPATDNADGYSAVTVNVPNSYAAGDEGKVVSNGAPVAQTSRTIGENGTYDTTTNNATVVKVPNCVNALPSDYQEVEYIKNSSHSTYIDTGVAGNDDELILEIAFLLKAHSNYRGIISNYVDEQSDCWRIIVMNADNGRLIFTTNRIAANSAGIDTGLPSIINEKIFAKLELNKCETTIENNTVSQSSSKSHGTENNSAIIIGSSGRYNTNTAGQLRIYYTKIYRGTQLIRSFIPCYRKSDDAIGMYDTVGGLFYTNAGTVPFEKGPDVNLAAIITTKTITENGTYNAEDDGAHGYSSVTVNISGGGGGLELNYDFTQSMTDTVRGVPVTSNSVTQTAEGAVMDGTGAYIRLKPRFSANTYTYEIDIASITMRSGSHNRLIMGTGDQGFIYRNSNKWAFYANSRWVETNVSDPTYLNGCTVKVYVDQDGYWHIYRNGVLWFEPGLLLNLDTNYNSYVSYFTIGASDLAPSSVTVTGLRVY